MCQRLPIAYKVSISFELFRVDNRDFYMVVDELYFIFSISISLGFMFDSSRGQKCILMHGSLLERASTKSAHCLLGTLFLLDISFNKTISNHQYIPRVNKLRKDRKTHRLIQGIVIAVCFEEASTSLQSENGLNQQQRRE